VDERERLAASFDGLADGYAQHRPAYPDELLDAATAPLPPGARVLEVGCGTGQLTRSLVARGLAVDALDPAPNMVRLARAAVGPSVCFHVGRFEELPLPAAPFAAVFSASAFHWLDPSVSWAHAAAALAPGGTLALLQYVGVPGESDDALLCALERVAPEIAAGWPRPRAPAELRAGVRERRANVSEVWSFVGRHDVAHAAAAELFGNAELTTIRVERERSADELNALLATTSLSVRLGPERAERLAAENRRVADAFGGRLRWTEAAVLVTARRR
jgi:SAM-dependent methyltransferase